MADFPHLSRRTLLTATSLALVGCSHEKKTDSGAKETASPTASPSATSSAGTRPTATGSPSPSPSASKTPSSRNPVTSPATWDGVATALPGQGNYLAWTVDDGADAEVIRAYGTFAQRTGTRLTFFVNGKYGQNFEQNMDVLGPLVESGQLQIGNHTYSHAALTSLSDAGVQDELMRNDEWIQKAFGAKPAPYFRAPYGYYDARVLNAAASVGYSRAVQWYGSFADSSPVTGQEILGFAHDYLKAQAIVIGHLNYPGVTEVFDDIAALIKKRKLQTVTLADYFTPPA